MMNGNDLRRISDMEKMRGTDNCVKCGDSLSSFQKPKYKGVSEGYKEESLQWTCSNCGFRWYTPCQDAEA